MTQFLILLVAVSSSAYRLFLTFSYAPCAPPSSSRNDEIVQEGPEFVLLTLVPAVDGDEPVPAFEDSGRARGCYGFEVLFQREDSSYCFERVCEVGFESAFRRFGMRWMDLELPPSVGGC